MAYKCELYQYLIKTRLWFVYNSDGRQLSTSTSTANFELSKRTTFLTNQLDR